MNAVLCSFRHTRRTNEQLVRAAESWSLNPPKGRIPKCSPNRKNMITEIAFLRTFLALESFLGESFILYLLGKPAPNGDAPTRYVIPPSRKRAEIIVIPVFKEYPSWDNPDYVVQLSEKCFKDGSPYKDAVQAHITMIKESKTIRNAIAHWSDHSKGKFKSLVRTCLGHYPAKLSVGNFLNTTVPFSAPPESFFEYYCRNLQSLADDIIPT